MFKIEFQNEKDYLVALRKINGITLQDVAKAIGLTATMISYFENDYFLINDEKYKLYKEYILKKSGVMK